MWIIILHCLYIVTDFILIANRLKVYALAMSASRRIFTYTLPNLHLCGYSPFVQITIHKKLKDLKIQF